MSRRYPEKVTFQDVASCFSEEECKLLHEWQKELYTNVMKEIQQSLMSLGPRIAASVFSLRVNEAEELFHVDSPDSERKHASGHSPRFQFIINEGASKNTDEAIVNFMSNPDTERGERSTERSAEVFSVHIKEEDTCNLDHEDIEMTESIRVTGSGIMNKQRKAVHPIKYSESTPFSQLTMGKVKAKVQKNIYKGPEIRTHIGPVSNRKLRGERTNQCESLLINSAPFSSHQKLGRLEKYDKRESKQNNLQFLKSVPNLQHNMRMFSCTQCNKSYSLKGELIRHMITHSGVRPYPCTECEKSFFQMPHLIRHQTTHSGEKPFVCTFCHKRFNRKDYLNAHRRIHTGERPYKCTECEKSFTWKGELNQHRKKHSSV
ncbi:zinc finger protein 425-like isoform X2 [Lissotriton helveticus]